MKRAILGVALALTGTLAGARAWASEEAYDHLVFQDAINKSTFSAMKTEAPSSDSDSPSAANVASREESPQTGSTEPAPDPVNNPSPDERR